MCATCGAVVTHEHERISIDGSHEHTRLNPAALAFRFGCFRDAEGCVVFGPATSEHSWFAGCAWAFAHCRGCGVHLGWHFSGAMQFFGLVLQRLRSG